MNSEQREGVQSGAVPLDQSPMLSPEDKEPVHLGSDVTFMRILRTLISSGIEDPNEEDIPDTLLRDMKELAAAAQYGDLRSRVKAWRIIGLLGAGFLGVMAFLLVGMFCIGLQITFAAVSVRSLTYMAAFLAGHKRPTIHEEWAAHLAGESGHDPANWQKVKQALGFLISALCYRCSDIADATWTPIDTVLKSRTLSNLSVLIPTTTAGYLVLHHEGTLGVITSAESIIAIAATLYGLIRTGRWWRNVKPSEPKARRSKA